jgi:hypothetical protein
VVGVAVGEHGGGFATAFGSPSFVNLAVGALRPQSTRHRP